MANWEYLANLKPAKSGYNRNHFSKTHFILFILAFSLVGIVIYSSLAAPNPNLQGDLNNDNVVDLSDISILAAKWHTSDASADINTDGIVDLTDLSILVTNFWKTVSGTACAATPPAGFTKIAFCDDFSGTSLDTTVWQPYNNNYGSGNNELECNTPNNVSVSSGSLKITAKRESLTCPGAGAYNFTSGFLGTRETGHYFPKYGYYEIRAKLPHGQGLWPAFWLRHKNGASTAEVDIMEYFHSQVPGKTTSTLHLDGVSNVSKKTVFFETPTATPAWHTWGVDIEPSGSDVSFSFYLDGVQFHSYTDTQHLWANTTDTNLFDIAVNLAVGGNWVGRPDDALGYLYNLNTCAQGGTPPNACISTGILRAAFPATYEVDYVHVFQK